MLLEGELPNQQVVVKVTIGQTMVIHSSHMWKTRDKNSGTMSVKLVHVDIPQHPVDLHTIVTRGTKELSYTLKEFRSVRVLQRGKTFAQADPDQPDGGPIGGAGPSSSNIPYQSPKLNNKRQECETPTPQKLKSPQASLELFLLSFYTLIKIILTLVCNGLFA